jgi:predicted component of type VI protein secretion system
MLIVAGVLIALIYISYKEYKERKYVKGAISKFLGYLEIVGGPGEFMGDRFGIRERNTIGSSRTADIIIPDETVMKTHARLFREKDELMLLPTARSDTKINGRKAINKHRVRTGDVISIGGVDFYVYIKRTRVGHDD